MNNNNLQRLEELTNHPNHYTKGDIECIEAIESALGQSRYIGYLQGNIIKYIWRFPHKGNLLDLKKARFYLEELIKVLESDENNITQ